MKLSKSKYTRYCQCPKMLWMDTYKKECGVEDPALIRRFAEGNEVGDLAMGLFGDFVETTACTEDGKLDIPAMLKNTKKIKRNILIIITLYVIAVIVGIALNAISASTGWLM